MSVFVPDNENFSLQDVFNAVDDHANPTGDLSDCFADSIPGYFDPAYNNDGYTLPNSMLRFRNYGGYNIFYLLGFCWELDDSGDTVVDASGNYNGMTDAGDGNLVKEVTGKLNKAYEITGQGDGFFSHNIPAHSTYSISLWFNGAASDLSLYDFIWLYSNDGLCARGATAPFPTGTSWLFFRHQGNYISTAKTISNTWKHLVITRSPSGFKLYIDGVLQFTYSGTLAENTTYGFYSGGYWTFREILGKYDQVAFWLGREITLEEVQFLYNSGNGRAYSNWT